jgi:hypothetical protein
MHPLGLCPGGQADGYKCSNFLLHSKKTEQFDFSTCANSLPWIEKEGLKDENASS